VGAPRDNGVVKMTKLQDLVTRWRKGAGPGNGDYYSGMDAALAGCADELAAALAEPSEQDVERAAERVWHEMPLFSEPGDRWETAQSWVKERCRIIARAALEATRRRA
jgi:hypothetical protein